MKVGNKMMEITSDFNLRPVKLSDASALFEFCSNPELVKYLTWVEHKTIDDTIFAIENIYFKNNPISFAIVNEEDTAIGIIDFVSLKSVRSNYPEIGYFLNPKYHNLGIMTKALNKVLDIGFNSLGFDVISISHIEENTASQKVILKNEFKYTHTINNFIVKNKTRTLLYYEMKGTDFNEKTKRNI